MTKHKHKFLPYKEIEIPTGKYLASRNSGDLTALTKKALILYCEICGDIKGKLLELLTHEPTH